MKRGSAKPVHCAIYTRVSTDQGLEQDFNSLDAQQDAAQAYIRSQAHAGWSLLRAKYEDGGFWAATPIGRPYGGSSTMCGRQGRRHRGLQGRPPDPIVGGLRKLIELFDQHGVSFVSVTQQFNTTTSMGRLTLNVLLSFAQFEREVTSERIRDEIAASKRKGLWVGGMAPLGYDTKDRRITVNAAEAERVRTIFGSYLRLGSLGRLMVAQVGHFARLGKSPKSRECVVVDAVPIGKNRSSRVNSRLSGKRIGNSVNSRGRNPFASKQMPDVTSLSSLTIRESVARKPPATC